MQHHRISKLLSDSTVSKFIKRKWIEGNDLSGGQYPVHSNIRFKTSMLRSDFCDDSYTYVVVKMKSDVAGNDNGNRRNKKLAFKKNAPFRSYIWKIHRQCKRSWYCYANV